MGPSRSPSSRSGATCPLRSLASPKLLLQLKSRSQDNNMSLSLPFESIFIIDLLYHSEPRLNQQFSLIKIFGLVQFMIVSTTTRNNNKPPQPCHFPSPPQLPSPPSGCKPR